MRQFLKFFVASVFGTFAGLFLTFFFGVLILASISTGLISKAKDKKVDVKPNSILHINLDYPIMERTNDSPFDDFDFSTMEPKVNLGLNSILKSIENAKDDDNIKGIYLEVSVLASGWATTNAVRKALIDFKKSEKFIVAYGEIISQKAIINSENNVLVEISNDLIILISLIVRSRKAANIIATAISPIRL